MGFVFMDKQTTICQNLAVLRRIWQLEINVNDEIKMADIWLTNAEKNNPAVKAQPDQVYVQFKKKKHMVDTFLFENQPLQPSISDLLKYNRRKSAEVAVQKAKGVGRPVGMDR